MRVSFFPSLRWPFPLRASAPEANAQAELCYPLAPVPCVAVLGCQLQPAPGVHCLPHWTGEEVVRIGPMALAASFQDLQRLAEMMRGGALELPELCYPLLVFSRPGEGALSLEQHDELWSWFGLPCFEQIRDGSGRLLAHECEARDGFHLTGDGQPAQVGGWLMQSSCECGQATPRVRITAMRWSAANAGD